MGFLRLPRRPRFKGEKPAEVRRKRHTRRALALAHRIHRTVSSAIPRQHRNSACLLHNQVNLNFTLRLALLALPRADHRLHWLPKVNLGQRRLLWGKVISS